MPQQIVVSGGAGFWCGRAGLALDRYVLSLAGRDRPRVCYLATASGDSDEFLQGFYNHLGSFCEVTHLPLFLPPFVDPVERLLHQDVIYVGGGSTANLLAVWRLHAIDAVLREACDRGTILYGSSAGGLCWFESGVTDSIAFDGVLRPLTNALGFIAGSHAPHFDEPTRREAYVAMVDDERLPAGVGIDEYAAAVFIDGQLTRTISVKPGATCHDVRRAADGVVHVTALPAQAI